MICTVGVAQVKYCYMNINSVQIQFIQYAFHSNQLQAEDALKMTCKSHESHLGAFLTISIVLSSVLQTFMICCLDLAFKVPQIPKSRGFKSGAKEGHSSLKMKLVTLAYSHSFVFLAPCDSAKSC